MRRRTDGAVRTVVPLGPFADIGYPRFSPDGTTIAFAAPQTAPVAGRLRIGATPRAAWYRTTSTNSYRRPPKWSSCFARSIGQGSEAQTREWAAPRLRLCRRDAVIAFERPYPSARPADWNVHRLCASYRRRDRGGSANIVKSRESKCPLYMRPRRYFVDKAISLLARASALDDNIHGDDAICLSEPEAQAK